jgi:hypothetical protein
MSSGQGSPLSNALHSYNIATNPIKNMQILCTVFWQF